MKEQGSDINGSTECKSAFLKPTYITQLTEVIPPPLGEGIYIIIIIIIIIIIMLFRKYMSNIPGKHEVKELQKTAILGTEHTLWKVKKGKVFPLQARCGPEGG